MWYLSASRVYVQGPVWQQQQLYRLIQLQNVCPLLENTQSHVLLASRLPTINTQQRSFIHTAPPQRPKRASGRRTDRACQNFSHIHNAVNSASLLPKRSPTQLHPPLLKPPVPQRTVHNRKRNKKIQKIHTKAPTTANPPLVTDCRLLLDSNATSPSPVSHTQKPRARLCVSSELLRRLTLPRTQSFATL